MTLAFPSENAEEARRSTLPAQHIGQQVFAGLPLGTHGEQVQPAPGALALCETFPQFSVLRGSSRFGGIFRLDFGGRVYAARQPLAIREHDVDDAPDRVPALDWQRSERNLIPNL
jgi:hypothetical protein